MASRRKGAHWRRNQSRDPWVQKARQEGLRSRAAYKLAELDRKYHLLRTGMVVVDLGSAPGGWSQLARSRLGPNGRVIALDLLPMEPLPGIEFIQGDFTDEEVLHRLEECLDGRNCDLVMSDMAPNISGNRAVDQPRAMYLAELAMDFAGQHLKGNGSLVVKLFQGEGFEDYLRAVRRRYGRVKLSKPEASRSRNREIYLVAMDYRL